MKKRLFLFWLILISIAGYFLNEKAKQVQAWVHERVYISSSSIEESRQIGVFDSDLQVDSIILINNQEKLLIEKAWIEKEQFKARKETYIEEGNRIIVIKLSKDSPEPYLEDSVNFTWDVNLNPNNTFIDNDYLKEEYPHQFYDEKIQKAITFNFIQTYKNETYRFDILRNKNQNEGKGRKVVGHLVLSKKL